MANFVNFRSSDGSVSGTIDGSNTVFTVPTVGNWIEVYVDGLQRENTIDYTYSGTTITFAVDQAPPTDALIVVWVFNQ